MSPIRMGLLVYAVGDKGKSIVDYITKYLLANKISTFICLG